MAAPSRISLVSPAVDFIDNRLSDHHPAFVDPPTYFDHNLDRYVMATTGTESALQIAGPITREPGALIASETLTVGSPASQVYSFSQILTEFRSAFPVEPKGRVDKKCSIRSATNWGEVLEIVELSGEAYYSSSGVKGKVRRAARIVGDRADTLKRVTGVVPDVDYSRPIVGALTFILDAFKQTSKARTAVKDGLEELKMKFGMIEDYLKIYSTKERIPEAVMTLYVSMLKALEEIIGYYTKNIVIKGLDAIWSGERYEESLSDCLEKINENGRKLIDAANYAHMEEGHEASENIKIVVKRSDSIKDALNNFRVMFEDLAEEHKRQMDLRQKENDRIQKEAQRLARQIDLVTSQNILLQGQYLRATTPQSIPPVSIVTQEDFVDFLNITGLEKTDLEYIMKSRETSMSVGQDRTDHIMKTPKFRDWLVNPSSKELLIHGNSDPQPVSPLSFFCAMLVQNLRSVDNFWSVTFCCGCHPYEDFGGGRIMIMSLIAQLLWKRPFDLSFIQHEHAYRMDRGDIDAFCFVFGQLIQQIKHNETVFCVIDGINYYEGHHELIEEMSQVVRFLLDLTKGPTVFKILITSPSTTEDVRQAIEDADYLALPAMTSNGRGFSDLRFERQWSESFAPN